MAKRKQKLPVWLFALAALALAGAGLVTHLYLPRALPATPFEFAVPQGSSLRAVAGQLAQAGVLPEPWSLVLLGRLHGRAGAIKAGHYQLTAAASPASLLELLTRGSALQSEIRFIEGWTLAQVRQALDAHPSLRHDSLGLPEADLARRLELAEPRLEGMVFPDTYFFVVGASDLTVLRRAVRTMQSQLGAAWQGRPPGLPYASPYEALIMASIVEKETGVGAERPMIAGVFVNRLRRGMRLETDPTVIYGLGDEFDGNLRRRDLESDTPYNTYTRAGLPPTPIAMPGLASLQAALNPARTEALFFVARGDGTSQFSSTLAEHQKAVRKYQLKK